MQPIPRRIPKEQKMRNTMKTTICQYGTGVLVAAALSLSPMAFGQEAAAVSQTTTTTSSDGTVTEFSPTGDTVVLHSDTSAEPMRYSYSKSTTVVDQNGAPVDVSIIKTGIPVQVFYDRTGDQMVARKIVVHTTTTVPAQPQVIEQPPVIEKKTVTTTTTQGQ
jgi:hypothetical protein